MTRNVPFYSDRLGYVSAINESLGRMDAINTKDLNGNHSYGKWQIYGGGTMQRYLKSMAQMGGEHARIAARLNQFKVNSPEFDRQWKLEAQAHPELLEQSQYQFIKATHYDPLVKGFNPELQKAINSNRGLQEALWQASVLGPGAARGLFNKGWKEGGGDIRKLVDVVYRDMHKYQQSYIRQNPTHLPVLLRQHEASKGKVIDILNDSSRNGMVVGMPGQAPVAPVQTANSAPAPIVQKPTGIPTDSYNNIGTTAAAGFSGGFPLTNSSPYWNPWEAQRNQIMFFPTPYTPESDKRILEYLRAMNATPQNANLHAFNALTAEAPSPAPAQATNLNTPVQPAQPTNTPQPQSSWGLKTPGTQYTLGNFAPNTYNPSNTNSSFGSPRANQVSLLNSLASQGFNDF